MNRPWMPLYVADYRADTAHLNAAQHGAYLLLIMHYWQTGALPHDDAPLARITCMTNAEWRKTRPIVAAFFTPDWRHKRIDAELARAADISSKRRASAEQRHSKSNALAEQVDTHARASPPSPSQPQERTSLRSVARKARAIPEDWSLSEHNEEYAISRGWTIAYAHSEAERFKNHFLGNGAPKKNWDATWRNWVTSPYQQGKKNGTGADVMGAFDNLIERAKMAEGGDGDQARDITPRGPEGG